eukprot:6183146-Pleurochrysis_carterae.AAC.1
MRKALCEKLRVRLGRTGSNSNLLQLVRLSKGAKRVTRLRAPAHVPTHQRIHARAHAHTRISIPDHARMDCSATGKQASMHFICTRCTQPCPSNQQEQNCANNASPLLPPGPAPLLSPLPVTAAHMQKMHAW